MDPLELTQVLRLAEAMPCETPELAGLGLGELMTSWPDEVLSGRVVKGRGQSANQKATRAYVKFVQAFHALSEAVHELELQSLPVLNPTGTKRGR